MPAGATWRGVGTQPNIQKSVHAPSREVRDADFSVTPNSAMASDSARAQYG